MTAKWPYQLGDFTFPDHGSPCGTPTSTERGDVPPLGDPAKALDADRKEDQSAQCHLLIERVQAEQVVAVSDQRKEQNAEDGPPHRALSSQDAGAPYHDSRDDGERERVATVRRLCAQNPRGVDEAAESGRTAADH